MAVTVHTHEDSSTEGGPIGYQSFRMSAQTSLSGTLSVGTFADLSLAGWCYFPMIAVSHKDMVLYGHSVDGASADAARFAVGATVTTGTYNVDYHYIEA